MMKPQITTMAKRATSSYMNHTKSLTILECVPEAPQKSHRGVNRHSSWASSDSKIIPPVISKESEL